MADVHTPEQRSRNMSSIRGKDTKPEIILRKALWNATPSLRYRLKNKLPGRPDIIFPVERIAIFVDGCFWHMCPEHFVMPKTRQEFWMNKLRRNVERDLEVNATLQDQGWRVYRVWEHAIRSELDMVVDQIAEAIAEQTICSD